MSIRIGGGRLGERERVEGCTVDVMERQRHRGGRYRELHRAEPSIDRLLLAGQNLAARQFQQGARGSNDDVGYVRRVRKVRLHQALVSVIVPGKHQVDARRRHPPVGRIRAVPTGSVGGGG